MKEAYIKGTLKAETGINVFTKRLLELYIRGVKALKKTLSGQTTEFDTEASHYALLEIPKDGMSENACDDIWLTWREQTDTAGSREYSIKPLTGRLKSEEEATDEDKSRVIMGALWIGEGAERNTRLLAQTNLVALQFLVNSVPKEDLENLIEE